MVILDVGVIGIGVMGRNHARVYSELKAVGKLYLCDIDRKASRTLAETLDATDYFPTVESLLEYTDVDAVSICVPTPYHSRIAEQVIDEGIPLLIEKPICATVCETERLIEMIPDDLIVGVGHIERFNPIIPEIMKIIQHPLYIEMKRHNPASSRVDNTSVVEDLMIHDVDVLQNILFPNGVQYVTSSGNKNVCGALFTSDENTVYLSASRKSSKKIRMIYIEEEGFTIEGDFMTQTIHIYRNPEQYFIKDERYTQENIVETVMVNKQEPLKLELSTFLDCVARDKPFPVTPAQALMNMEMCERIMRCFPTSGGK